MATPIKKEENEFLKLNKEKRCTTFARGDYIPGSYKDNTLKEELILEHVLQYKKEFGLTYDSKRAIIKTTKLQFNLSKKS